VTLGLGDVNPQGDAAKVLTVLEAGAGFGFLALVIGYLPVLYQAFARRELTISLLDSRAGSPPSVGEFLRRQRATGDYAEELTRLLREWEAWCGELLESHVSFPVLGLFYSQHERQSWLSTLTFILDLSSLLVACRAHPARGQAERTFAIARHAAVDLAQVLDVQPKPCPYKRLDEEELIQLKATLAEPGAEKGAEFDPQLHVSLREMYEPYVYALGKRHLMPLPPWLPDPEAVDDWRKSPWA
jgi:hypothetical protein